MKNIFLVSLTAMMIFSFLFLNCQKPAEENVVLYPSPDDPTISFRIWIKVGSQNDPPGKAGLAALTADMLCEGGTQKHSYKEIVELLYPMAAEIQAQVDKEMTIIYGRVHKDNLNAYYEIFREVLLEPAFNEDDFQRLKTDRINFIENSLRYANDEELGKAALSEFIFSGTPYEHFTFGHLTDLRNMKVDDVKDFYHTYFHQRNIVIGLGGGYPSQFVSRLINDIKILPEGQPSLLPKIEVMNIDGIEVKIIEKPASATAISFGFPITVVRGQDDYYALAVANSWLGEHRNSSSHLYQVIREARGLNYGDYSYIEYFPNGGSLQFPPANVARRHQFFEIWIRPVPNEARLFAFRAALRELKDLVDNGMSEEEFELTRKFLKNYILHYAPTTMMKLGYAIDDKFYGISGSHLELFGQALEKLNVQQVNQAIKKHLQYQNLKVVFVTPDAEKLKYMLMNNLPSPINYPTPKSEQILQEDQEISVFPLEIHEDKIYIVPVQKMFE